MKYFIAGFVALLWFGMGLANHESLARCEKKRGAEYGIELKIIALIGAPIFWPVTATMGPCGKGMTDG